jgi:DNA-directed RNA polymerase specialized sigma subunit
MRGTAKPHTASRRNVKKQNAVSGPYATATLTDEHDDTRDQPFYEIVPDGFSIPSLDVLERKELLSLLAQRIAQLPLASKKLLAMYYYENLPISGIAACFNLSACQIYEILEQTVGLLGNDILKIISRKVI